MSEVRPDVDLQALARPSARVARPRKRAIRWLVPLTILGVFAAILAISVGDLFRGSIPVTIARPKAAEASAGVGTGAVLLQAAGWVEPDPFAIQVSALAPGIVREVLVQESDVVKAGDPVAHLVDDEEKLKLTTAEAALSRARAERDRARVEANLAQESYDQALGVNEAAAVARAELAGKRAESERRVAAVARTRALVKVAEEELAIQQELAHADAAGPRQLELAQAKVEEARSALATVEADAALVAAEVEKAAARNARAARELELRLDDRLRKETAQASLALAEAAVAEAEAVQSEVALRLERTTVRAPCDGVVLERLATPGLPLQGAEHGAPICTLYDPKHLRVRVDVPQADIAKVAVGSSAQILAESRAGKPYAGEVIRIVQRADIQKVTLQVHVRVLDGDALLHPEMLTQVRFLLSSPADAAGGAGASPRVLVPARLVQDDQSVWVIDGVSHTARRQRVHVGMRQGEWVEIESGLNLSDKLIDGGREGLREGARVTIRGGE
jgi:HlyD family secretion protein